MILFYIYFVFTVFSALKSFMCLQVGGIYVRLFLKDPKFPLRNPKRFLEGLLDQYLSSIAATHYDIQSIDPELPLLLSAALVSLLRVHPALADHVGYLGYVPKLVAAVAYEGRRETMATGEVNNGTYTDRTYESEDGSTQPAQTPQERVRLSCLRVLHQLAASTTCAEAMAATSFGTPQVCCSFSIVPCLLSSWLCIYSFFMDGYGACSRASWNVFIHLIGGSFPTLRANAFTDIILMSFFLSISPCLPCFQVVPLLMKAIGWQGGSILALETLKRVVVAGNRARDALVAQGLK